MRHAYVQYCFAASRIERIHIASDIIVAMTLGIRDSLRGESKLIRDFKNVRRSLILVKIFISGVI